MATFTATKAGTGVQAKSFPTGVIWDVSTYTMAGEAAGSVLQMLKLPTGARIVYAELQVAAGVAATLVLGDTLDPDRYILATTAITAAIVRRNNTAATPYTVTGTGDTTLDVTTATAAGTGRIDVIVGYVMDP